MNILFLSFQGRKHPNINRTKIPNILKQGQNVNNKGLSKDTFEYTSVPIRTQPKTEQEKVREKYNNVIKSLELIKDNAQASFQSQCDKNGFLSKSYDNVKALFMSNNREKFVKKDIDIYNEQLNELSKSIKTGKFTKTFKKIFGLPYDQKNIDNFNKANTTLTLATTTKYLADTINKTIGEDLQIAEKNKGKLKDYINEYFSPYAPTGSIPVVKTTIDKEKVFEKMEESLSKAVGGSEILENMLLNQQIKNDATKEEKYKAYYEIANFLSETGNKTAQKWSNGKTLKELTKDYNEAYEKAFGKNNNIQKRVDNYNRSQQIGVTMLKTGIKSPIKLAILAITGITNPLAMVPATVALDFGVDMFEKATNKDEDDEILSNKTLKELVKDTSINYADYLITTGANAILPNFKTGSVLLNDIISTARKTTIDVATSMITEYMETGEWDKSQIAPRAFVSAVFGKISPDDELSKSLLTMTEDGVKKSLLYDNIEKNSVKQFLNKMQTELQQEYMKNPEIYSAIKSISVSNPKAFETMILDLLQEHIDEKANKDSKNN